MHSLKYFVPLFLLLTLATLLYGQRQMAVELNVPNVIYTADADLSLPKANRKMVFWITNPDISVNDYSVTLYRKTIKLEAKPERFIIHITADNRYRLYINGKYIAYGPQASDIQHWRYETFDIASYLTIGENTIAAEVINFGQDRFFGFISHKTGLMIKGNSELESVINTEDKTWKTWHNKAYRANHPNWMYGVDIVGGFYASNPADSVLASLYPWGWEQPSFDDSAWKKAIYAGSVSFREGGFGWMLTPRTTPMQVEKEEKIQSIARSQGIQVPSGFLEGKSPLTVPPNTKCTLLLDHKTLTLGYPEMIISGGKNARIRIHYAENLYDKNKNKAHRSKIEGMEIRGINDVYLVEGGKNRVYRPLWIRSFRFIQIEIETKDDTLIVSSYQNILSKAPLSLKASFKSNNPLYDKIWEICWRTVSLCTQDNLVSDAYYEQMQYVGDSRVHAMTLVALTGDSLYLKNAIEMFHYSRLDDGNITSCYPLRGNFIHPTFTLIWVDMLHDYMMYFGNKQFLKTFTWGIEASLYAIERTMQDNGLPGEPKTGSYFVDWYHDKKTLQDKGGVAPTSKNGNSAVVSLHYLYSLQRAHDIYTYLGMNLEAGICKEKSKTLSQNIQQAFYSTEHSMYFEDLNKTYFDQRPNIMAVQTQLIDENQGNVLFAKLLKDTTNLSKAGFYYRFNWFSALSKVKNGGAFFDDILKPWKTYMLDRGLTTTPERPEAQRSDCHPWSTSPVYGYFHSLVGIRPTKPGFSEAEIAPQFGSNTKYNATYPTVKGDVHVDISRKGTDKLIGTITIPDGLNIYLVWNGKRMLLKPGNQKIDY